MNAGAVKKLFQRQRDAAADISGAVEEVRLRVITLQDERQQIARLPVDRARAETAVDQGIAMMARKLDVRNIMAGLVRPTSGSPRLDLGHVPEALFAPWLATIAGDQLRDFFLDQIDAFYDARDDLPEAERRTEIERLDAQVLGLELAEEALVRQAERAGLAVLRRADLDPRAALAADAALPS